MGELVFWREVKIVVGEWFQLKQFQWRVSRVRRWRLWSGVEAWPCVGWGGLDFGLGAWVWPRLDRDFAVFWYLWKVSVVLCGC
jgi:hypothetical protein